MKRDSARRSRKLLVASIGVATVSYTLLTACEKAPSGNLMAPQPPSSGTTQPSATPAVGDAGSGSGLGSGSAPDAAGKPK